MLLLIVLLFDLCVRAIRDLWLRNPSLDFSSIYVDHVHYTPGLDANSYILLSNINLSVKRGNDGSGREAGKGKTSCCKRLWHSYPITYGCVGNQTGGQPAIDSPPLRNASG